MLVLLFIFSDDAEEEVPGDEESKRAEDEDDEAEMVRGGQGRKCSAPSEQVSVKSEAARKDDNQTTNSNFQMMPPTGEDEDEDEAEMVRESNQRKRSAPSDTDYQVNLLTQKCNLCQNAAMQDPIRE